MKMGGGGGGGGQGKHLNFEIPTGSGYLEKIKDQRKVRSGPGT